MKYELIWSIETFNFTMEFRKINIFNMNIHLILTTDTVPVSQSMQRISLQLEIWFLGVRITWENCWMIKKPLLIQWGQLNIKYFGQTFTLHCWRPDNAVQSNHCNFAKYFFSSTFNIQPWCLLLSYLAYISIWLECKFFAPPALKSHPSFLITIHANLVVIRPTLRR